MTKINRPWVKLFKHQIIADINKLVCLGSQFALDIAKKASNTFWVDVLKAWDILYNEQCIQNDDQLISTPLWYNAKLSTEILYFPKWFKRGIITISDILDTRGTVLTVEKLKEWALQLQPGQPTFTDFNLDVTSRGMGLHEAPRGALGHWIVVEGGKTKNYQAVVPTTWNAGPMDAKGQPGPIEQSIIGTKVKDAKNPFELVRIVRSYDPCLSCAVHVVTPKGEDLGRFVVGAE